MLRRARPRRSDPESILKHITNKISVIQLPGLSDTIRSNWNVCVTRACLCAESAKPVGA
ncbi:hypothetical protein QUF72_17820 [Desulfobacterales bacterium HSG2]|nr:hypothetical protein [Desulfobacterales bacterium HSG2]